MIILIVLATIFFQDGPTGNSSFLSNFRPYELVVVTKTTIEENEFDNDQAILVHEDKIFINELNFRWPPEKKQSEIDLDLPDEYD